MLLSENIIDKHIPDHVYLCSACLHVCRGYMNICLCVCPPLLLLSCCLRGISHQTWNSSVPGFLLLCQHPCVRLPGAYHHTCFLHRCLRSKPRPSYLNRKHFTNWIISQLLNTLLIYNFTCYTYYIWCLNEIK